MRRKRDQRDYSRNHGVPIQDARMRSQAKICPKRFEEIAVGTERYSADYISQCCSKENCKQCARNAEDHIEEPLPHRIVHMCAKFDSDPAQHEQPEDNHERQIEAAESGGIELR